MIQILKEKYKITQNRGCMPNQILGEISDGQFFYFRGDDQYACLHFGTSIDDAVHNCFANKTIWEGRGQTIGWMDDDEFEALFWSVILVLET